MNKERAKELNVFCTTVAERFSNKIREGNINNETFSVDDMLALSAGHDAQRKQCWRQAMGSRQTKKARHRRTLKTRSNKQEKAKAHYYNSRGYAKTVDYYLKTEEGRPASRLVAKRIPRRMDKSEIFEFRRYTPEFILKVANENPQSSGRANLPKNTAPGAAAQCSKTVATAVHLGQKKRFGKYLY